MFAADLAALYRPPVRAASGRAPNQLVSLGVQLEVEAASPVPRRRVYARVHVQLLENVVDVVLHGCQLADETAGDCLVGHAVLDSVQNRPFPTRQRPRRTVRPLLPGVLERA